MKMLLRVAATLAAISAAPAGAVTFNVPVTGADNTCGALGSDTAPLATRCVGYFGGNLLNQSHGSTINAALSSLGVTYSGRFADYFSLTGVAGVTDFAPLLGTLSGLQTIGIHYGNGGGTGSLGNVTAFYQIDFGSADTLKLNVPTAASLVLFTRPSAVPETGTWMLMLFGFGAVSLSFRRKQHQRFAQLA